MNRGKREDARKPGRDEAAVRQQQHTGNHPEPDEQKGRPYGADDFGGTRAGAENVEPQDKARKPK